MGPSPKPIFYQNNIAKPTLSNREDLFAAGHGPSDASADHGVLSPLQRVKQQNMSWNKGIVYMCVSVFVWVPQSFLAVTNVHSRVGGPPQWIFLGWTIALLFYGLFHFCCFSLCFFLSWFRYSGSREQKIRFVDRTRRFQCGVYKFLYNNWNHEQYIDGYIFPCQYRNAIATGLTSVTMGIPQDCALITFEVASSSCKFVLTRCVTAFVTELLHCPPLLVTYSSNFERFCDSVPLKHTTRWLKAPVAFVFLVLPVFFGIFAGMATQARRGTTTLISKN